MEQAKVKKDLDIARTDAADLQDESTKELKRASRTLKKSTVKSE